MLNKVTKPAVDKKEEKYRKENIPDVNKIVDKKLLCTSCNISVKPLLLKGKTKVHPFMDTLLCEKCFTFFGDGDFSTDEDGSDKYCRWCGQGGTLYLCSKCTAGFCKRCIKRNLPRAVWKEVEEDDWECLCCNVEPLYELRAQAWASLEYVKNNFKEKNDSASRKRKTKADSDSESESTKKSGDEGEDEETKSSAKKSKRSEENDEEEAKPSRKSSRSSKKKTKGAAGDSSDEEKPDKKAKDKLKTKQFKYARSKLTEVLNDVSKMMDITKRKAEDYKKKKVTPQRVNDLESVVATADNIKTMLTSVEELSAKLRERVTDFTTSFEKTIQDQNGLEDDKKAGEENGEMDTSEKKDEANDSEGEKQESEKKDSTDVEMKEPNEADDEKKSKEDESEDEPKSEAPTTDKAADLDTTVDPNASSDDLKESESKETVDPKSDSN